MTEVTVDDSHGVRTVAIAAANGVPVLTESAVAGLYAAVHTAYRDQCVAVVLRSEGRAFCAGFDLSDVDRVDDARLAYRLTRVEILLQRIRSLPVVVVAGIDGPAIGAGADLALSCNFRVGTPAARFRFPGPGFGLVLGTRHLAATVGRDVARDILLRQRTLDATEARRVGILTALTGTDSLAGEVASIIDGVSGLDRGTVRAVLAATSGSGTGEANASMADLVSSATVTGLRQRIVDYRDRSHAARTSASATTPAEGSAR